MTIVKISTFYVIMGFLFSIVKGDSLCRTPNGASDPCISVTKCEPVLNILRNKNRTQQEIDYIKSLQCGRDSLSSNPLVCCPSCITPDGRAGTCVDLYACPAILSLLTAPVPKDVLEFVQNSRCRSSSQFSVCCGSDVSDTITTEVLPSIKGVCLSNSAPPDPNTECCGLDESSGDRIFGGSVTAIDQYPWLVIIEYRGIRDKKIKLLCGGSLISGRYVLTAAHCVTGPILAYGTPVNVRVGDYDTANSGPDCVPVAQGGKYCTEGAQVIPIEEVIPHVEYDPKSSLRRHDIALIRLRQLATYTDFIRPICLPNSDIDQIKKTQTLYAAGWGAVSEFQSSSIVKLQVDLPLVNLQECQPSYNVSNRVVVLWDGQLCAGGVKGKDSCKGDSGGPLMYNTGRVYTIVGVTSFGPTPCGIENVPGVYTNVFAYLSWINSKIKP